ncbi:transmembrane protease serine 9-like [Pollicipes pollicipes]|uniref:transmembrane protease serine 9-like n=1 Tax=Pollicipes pollicipes TaxID=41117 RepID=UPI001884AE1F|nr:transmembrane protease serine 9-like [Pollicipes pollicipes]
MAAGRAVMWTAAVLLLACRFLPATGRITFPQSDGPKLCQTSQGGDGVCVSLLSRRCSLFTRVEQLVTLRPRLCAVSQRDALVCCPLAAVASDRTGGAATPPPRFATPGTRPTRPPSRPTRPETRPTRPPRPQPTPTRPETRPTIPTKPPTRFTRPTASPPTESPPTRSRPPARPTGPSRGQGAPPNRHAPIGLRPRPSNAPSRVAPTASPGRVRPHRLRGCGISRPLTAFRAFGNYFQRPPSFARVTPVQLGAQPWTALVGTVDEAGVTHWLCAGALLTPRIVLTNAHCAGGSPRQLLVGLGEHDLTSESDGTAGTHPVLAVERHPAWTHPSRRHDLALLLLARPADQSTMIQPVCLPPPDPTDTARPLRPPPGSELRLVGYGLDATALDTDGSSSRGWQETTTAAVAPLADCGAALAASPLAEFLFPGGSRAGPDLCLAAVPRCDQDAGGPVVARAPDGVGQLEGLQLMDSCMPGQPQLALRVRHYVPFILETMDRLLQRVGRV